MFIFQFRRNTVLNLILQPHAVWSAILLLVLYLIAHVYQFILVCANLLLGCACSYYSIQSALKRK